jgi:hypothetical protein
MVTESGDRILCVLDEVIRDDKVELSVGKSRETFPVIDDIRKGERLPGGE